jgi:hypothetical protein
MRLRFSTIGLVLAAFLGQSCLVHGSGFRQVWEVDLRKAVHADNGLPSLPVFALRFSPDGRKLAVIADIYVTRGGRKSRLLVVDVDHPSGRTPQFEVEFGILENELGWSALNFGWTPSGDVIYALGKVIHLESGATCDLPNQSVFVNDHFALKARAVPAAGLFSPTRITFYSRNCEEQSTWDVPESWLVKDVSTDRSLLSVTRQVSITKMERLIVDPLARKVLQRRPDNLAWEFADGGKAICGGGNALGPRPRAVCWNVDTGEVIREMQTNGTEPIAAAAHATRLVVSDYRRRKPLFDYEYRTIFKGRVVWDFGSGKVLASWLPESETYPYVSSHGKQITEPFRFAMSPDGQYVAEGGGGKLRIYKIEP